MYRQSLLLTKLNRPKSFQTYFKRERLEKILEKNSDRVATLIVAGAGCGKSTLVSQWIQNKQSVWISCDTDMNNLQVFLSYIVFGFAKEKINSFPQTSLLLSGQNPVSNKVLINTFISEANSTSKKAYVVLDDFHLIDDPQIAKLLALYLRFPPENIHVMILTRHDLVYGFSKQRLNDVFHELRMKQLNLSKTELKQYAQANYDLKLAKEHVDLIIKNTEGWFLGVSQLLSAYATLQIPLNANDEIIGSDQFSRYFAEEVMDHQSANIHKILYVCSLFYQFSKELIESVLLRIDPGFPIYEITGALLNKNNFTIGLDNSNTWYRFHHQFHEALKSFFQTHPYTKQRDNCLQWGGEWLVQNEFYEDGIQKMIESGNISLAVKHLQCFRYDLLNTDQYTRLGHLLSLFPDVEQKSNIELILINAIILENQGKYMALAEILDNCSDSVGKGELSNQQLGEYRVLQSVISFYSGEYSDCFRLVDEGLELMSDYAHSIITFAYAYKALSLNALSQTQESLTLLSMRLDSLHITQYQSIVRTLIPKAIIYSLHSDLESLQVLIPQVIEISEQHNLYETLGMGLYYQIETSYRIGKPDKINLHFDKGYEIRYLMRPVWYAHILAIKIHFSLHQDGKSPEEAINQLEEFALEQKAENITQLQNALLIEVALREGNYSKALRVHQQTNYHLYPPIYYYYLPQITELKVRLYASSDGNLDEFFKASENLWKYGQAQQHRNLLLKLNILTSVAYFMQGKNKDAARFMSDALSISEGTGDRFVFKEFSEHVYEILAYMQKNAASTPYLQHILSLFEVSARKNNKADVELKDRDIKILGLVAEGFTNAQIADQMFLSPESVKKYLYDIFGDLEVKNRMNAVLKARELGLIK